MYRTVYGADEKVMPHPHGLLSLRSAVTKSESAAPCDRRHAQRIASDDSVVIAVIGQPEGSELAGRIADVSRDGLGLRTDRRVAPGARVEVRWKTTSVFGEVRYCRRQGDEFKLGLNIENVVSVNPSPAPVP